MLAQFLKQTGDTGRITVDLETLLYYNCKVHGIPCF